LAVDEKVRGVKKATLRASDPLLHPERRQYDRNARLAHGRGELPARLLQDVREGMPDEESAAQITTGFQRHWDKPPLTEIEMLLQRTTSLHDARLLLFFPEPVDMIRFVTLVQRAPAGAPPDHPQNKVRVPFLALLYMQHVKNWPLMRAFIQEGGLRALADSFADDNIYLRAQAVDTMMQLTNTELHDWFEDPSQEPAVQRRWLDLAAPEANFVKHIALNLDNSFPGGSFYCLQILAFWLSLLRYFYCEQRVLRLGTNLCGRHRPLAPHQAQGRPKPRPASANRQAGSGRSFSRALFPTQAPTSWSFWSSGPPQRASRQTRSISPPS
jgi:hypothetical protein